MQNRILSWKPRGGCLLMYGSHTFTIPATILSVHFTSYPSTIYLFLAPCLFLPPTRLAAESTSISIVARDEHTSTFPNTRECDNNVPLSGRAHKTHVQEDQVKQCWWWTGNGMACLYTGIRATHPNAECGSLWCWRRRNYATNWQWLSVWTV